RVYELDAETARAIRHDYETLAANYGAALEQYRMQAMQSIGTAQPAPQFIPPQPDPFTVPDPDLLFQNKQGWSDALNQSIDGRIGQVEARQTQLAQGLATAFQQELARRDALQQARSKHDQAMQDMLERRQLTENQLVVQAVYDREFEKLRNLPLELALDQ